nr:hypothetical protein [Tanacetum cinerariifolium]
LLVVVIVFVVVKGFVVVVEIVVIEENYVGMLMGVIELVTLVPKDDYGPDLNQISRLLRAENLHT